MIKIACSYVKSLFKCFNVNSFVQPDSSFICVSHSIVSLTVQHISLSLFIYIPWYLLTCLVLKRNMTFKKKMNEEQERLKSSGNLVLWTGLTSFILINQSIGRVLLYSTTGNKLQCGVLGV